MQKPESLLKNETNGIHCNFEILTDLLILAKRPD